MTKVEVLEKNGDYELKLVKTRWAHPRYVVVRMEDIIQVLQEVEKEGYDLLDTLNMLGERAIETGPI